jgi:hypothetical protein
MLTRDAAYEVVSTRGWLSLTPAAFRGAVLERCQLQEFGAGVPVYGNRHEDPTSRARGTAAILLAMSWS